ncbi:IS110 family transposase [Neisseria meningitidis]|nr:IS110 family transposase [Neisseria meningitidis]
MPYQPPTEAEEVLEALVNRRNQSADMRTAEKNRLHQFHETQVGSVKQLIAHFDRLIDELDKQIDDHTHTHFDGKAQVAEQIKGIGSITTATLMAMLPELGRLSHKRIASLVGIAPHPRESEETKFKAAALAEGLRCVRHCIWLPWQRHVLNRLFGISTNACCPRVSRIRLLLRHVCANC